MQTCNCSNTYKYKNECVICGAPWLNDDDDKSEVDKLTEENARLREALRQRVEFAYIEGFSDGRNDSELMQGNNAADEFKRSRAFESLEKLLKGDEDE